MSPPSYTPGGTRTVGPAAGADGHRRGGGLGRGPGGPNVRVASGVYEGGDIPPYYDSLFMLLMTAGADRKDAIKVMDRSLGRNLRVEGVKTLQPLLLSIIRHPSFVSGEFSTRFIE